MDKESFTVYINQKTFSQTLQKDVETAFQITN